MKPTYDPYANFQAVELVNGLKLFVNHIPNRPYQHVGFIIHSGAKDDQKGLEGQAHFVEHLVSKNIPGISYEGAREFFGMMGGAVNFGSTSYHATTYALKSLIGKIEESLSIFNRMLLGSTLESFIERERGVIINEYHRKFPSKLLFEDHQESASFLFGPDTRLGRFVSPIGSLDVINKLTQADLQKFYDSFYVPQNMSIVAVGGLDFTEIFKALSKAGWMAEMNQDIPPFMPKPADKFSGYKCKRKDDKSSELFTASAGLAIDGFEMKTALPKGLINPFAFGYFRPMLHRELDHQLRQKEGMVYGIDVKHWDDGEYLELEISTKLPRGHLDKIQGIVYSAVKSILSQKDKFEIEKMKSLAVLGMLDPNSKEIANNAIDDVIDSGRIETLGELYEIRKKISFSDLENIVDIFGKSKIFISTLDSTK